MSGRIVCQFSCGASSAVAGKLILAECAETRDVQLINAFIKEEHPDNRRFLADCEKWYGRPITVLRDEKYGASVIEVFRRKRYMKGRYGAPCSQELKRKVLDKFIRPDDEIVLGYDADEQGRLDQFIDNFPSVKVRAPLIEQRLGKADCLAIVRDAGIELPITYRMGYRNANCLCCIKGGEGYMNQSRRDFPEAFEALASVQDEIGPGAYLYRDRKTGERYSLRDLPADRGRFDDEPDISCSFFCEMAKRDISGDQS